MLARARACVLCVMCPARSSCGHLGLVHESASSRLLLMRHHGHLGASQGSGRERSGRERGLAVCVMRQGAGSVYIVGVGGGQGERERARARREGS